jgi:hypothetical protein
LVSSAKLLDDAYRTEKNVDVRERLLLVRRVLVDNEQISTVAGNEFHRSRWWAYKWVKKYAESGLEGLAGIKEYRIIQLVNVPHIGAATIFFLSAVRT